MSYRLRHRIHSLDCAPQAGGRRVALHQRRRSETRSRPSSQTQTMNDAPVPRGRRQAAQHRTRHASTQPVAQTVGRRRHTHDAASRQTARLSRPQRRAAIQQQAQGQQTARQRPRQRPAAIQQQGRAARQGTQHPQQPRPPAESHRQGGSSRRPRRSPQSGTQQQQHARHRLTTHTTTPPHGTHRRSGTSTSPSRDHCGTGPRP